MDFNPQRATIFPDTPAAPRPTNPQSTPTVRFITIHTIHSGKYGRLERVYALKKKRDFCLKIADCDNQKETDALMTELAAYKRIAESESCEFIMECHGYFRLQDSLCLAMDYIQKTMTSVLVRDIPFELRQRWVTQLAVGIDALHKMGIIHRDIKPDNVLVDKKDNIKIVDFGTAFVCQEPKKVVERGYYFETNEGEEPVGTIAFHPPEYYSEYRPRYGPMADYWALGCIFWNILTRKALFKDKESISDFKGLNPKGCLALSTEFPGAKICKLDYQVLCGLLDKNYNTRYDLDELRKKRAQYFTAQTGDRSDELATRPADSSTILRLTLVWSNTRRSSTGVSYH